MSTVTVELPERVVHALVKAGVIDVKVTPATRKVRRGRACPTAGCTGRITKPAYTVCFVCWLKTANAAGRKERHAATKARQQDNHALASALDDIAPAWRNLPTLPRARVWEYATSASRTEAQLRAYVTKLTR